MIIQIYEIQTPEEAERCRALGVDHIGSVLLATREWRQPSIRNLIQQTRGSSSKNSLIPLFAAALEKTSDFFLTDTWLGREPVEGYVGITGRPVDWDLAKKVVRQSRIPVILAGGLSPENAYDAVVSVRPAGADSCTLTNALDPAGKLIRFRKDFARVAAFVAEVRRAEASLAKDSPPETR
ncbi:MAG: hypothetical protein NTW38_07480 [Candidatus Aminicenantes bacterium]|nr:hypothetical protein [Candidatus Aminicenantes bacterium]